MHIGPGHPVDGCPECVPSRFYPKHFHCDQQRVIGNPWPSLAEEHPEGPHLGTMAAAVFEARYNRILRSREQGYEELSDFLGRHAGLGPLVRTGLLRRREENMEFQRYNGFVPTRAGEEFLLFIPEKELILVRPEKSASLFLALQNDPAPKAAFKSTYAEPTSGQFEAVAHMREQAGKDLWRLQRADELRRLLLDGYMDIKAFTKRTGIGEGVLLRLEFVKPRTERPHDRALHLEITDKGREFLHVADPWELLLIKPGMELPLFAVCEPDKAEYWCILP